MMRERQYVDGTRGGVSLPYENIPDNFDLKSCLTNGYDLSYSGFMKALSDKYKDKVFGSSYELGAEFQDKDWYGQEVTEHQAFDFLESAILLRNGLNYERDKGVVSHYTIPCAFCCRHSVELFLKYCALVKGIDTKKLICHKISDLWNILDEKTIPRFTELSSFISELDVIDENGMALRYGLNTSFDAPKENFQFNVDAMILNTMYLINVLTEFVVYRYRYSDRKEVKDYGC